MTGIGYSKQGTSTPDVTCSPTAIKGGFAGCLTYQFPLLELFLSSKVFHFIEQMVAENM